MYFSCPKNLIIVKKFYKVVLQCTQSPTKQNNNQSSIKFDWLQKIQDFFCCCYSKFNLWCLAWLKRNHIANTEYHTRRSCSFFFFPKSKQSIDNKKIVDFVKTKIHDEIEIEYFLGVVINFINQIQLKAK